MKIITGECLVGIVCSRFAEGREKGESINFGFPSSMIYLVIEIARKKEVWFMH